MVNSMKQPNRTNPKTVAVRVSLDLLQRIEDARGLIAREPFLRRLIDSALKRRGK